MRVRIIVLAVACLVAGLFPLGRAEAAGGSPEPFGSWTAMVNSQYTDLTGVAPTAAQRSAAVSALTAGTLMPGQLLANLRSSDDNVKNVDPVTRLYRAFLLRIPDKGGLTFWINRRRTGTWTLTKIADSFATSTEFKTRYGSLSNRNFVKLIYDNVLERPYDSSGLDFWTRQLDQKRKTRGAVMANFSESNEYKNKQAAEVNVSVLHTFLLGRAPTKADFATAVAALEGGQSVAAYAAELYASTAYANRIAAPLTIAAPTVPSLYAGVPMQIVLTATGGFGDRTWSATGLPGWATLDPTSGALSGTPVAAGITSVTAKVTAGSGMTGTKIITLDVKAGMPEGCVTTDCAQLDSEPGTVQIPAGAVSSVTRNGSGVPTAIGLAAAAPDIANGSTLVIGAGVHTPSGLIVEVTGFTGTNGAARNVSVTKSTLTDAYANGIVKSTGELDPEPDAATTPRTTRSAGCAGNADIDITPTATVGLAPSMTLLWGKNVAGFGNVYVGTGGVKLFQFELEGDLTYKLKGSISGSVDCSLDLPGVTVPIPLGPAGAAFFKLQPSLGLEASAEISIDTTVRVHCAVICRYSEGQSYRTQYCQPHYTTPSVETATAGADLTISGGVAASLTFNEAIGITGTITASLHAGYHPLQRPIGILDGKVTAELAACLACAFGGDAPSLTIANTTLWAKTFATWDSPSPPPELPLTIATTGLPDAVVGYPYQASLAAKFGVAPYTWSASHVPAGLTLQGNGTLTGTPPAVGSDSLTASVTDHAGHTVSRTLPLTVTEVPSGAPPVRISVASDGTEANGWSGQSQFAPPDQEQQALSDDGRFVAYASAATNLVPGDTNGYLDVFLWDRTTQTTSRVSVSTSGAQANGPSGSPAISGDGRYVSFSSRATNLVTGDTNSRQDIFVWDRTTGSTTRISVAANGTQANLDSIGSSMSSDGRFITYESEATNLVAGGTSSDLDVYLWDRTNGATVRVSASSPAPTYQASENPSISSNGRYIAYESSASTLVPGDTNGEPDIFVWDRTTGSTERITNGDSFSIAASISGDGRFVTFMSYATNLVPNDTNSIDDVFVWDRTTGTTVRITNGNDRSLAPVISADGRFVAYFFQGYLAPGDDFTRDEVYLWDRTTGATALISTGADGAPANDDAGFPAMSGDGRFIAYESYATNLVPDDTNAVGDIFLWDRLG